MIVALDQLYQAARSQIPEAACWLPRLAREEFPFSD